MYALARLVAAALSGPGRVANLLEGDGEVVFEGASLGSSLPAGAFAEAFACLLCCTVVQPSSLIVDMGFVFLEELPIFILRKPSTAGEISVPGEATEGAQVELRVDLWGMVRYRSLGRVVVLFVSWI